MIPIATLLSALGPSPWRKVALGLAAVLLVAVLCGVAARRAYEAGYAKADAVRLAEVREAQRLHAEEVARHAAALAAAEAEARRRLAAETARAAEVEQHYLKARRDLAAARNTITNRRIADASRAVVADPAGRCRFDGAWVRLYNEALGIEHPGHGGDAVPAAAPGPAGTAGTGQAADAGVLHHDPGAATVTAYVTPADILAHARDYGGRCQDLEARLRALITWAQDREAAWK